MPTPTYTLLDSAIITTNTADVTFSSIPNSYKDLVISASLIGTTSFADFFIRFNGSSVSYSDCRMSGNGSSANSSVNESNEIYPNDAGGLTTGVSHFSLHLIDYSATNKHKIGLMRFDNAANGTNAVGFRWANTAAVSSILIDPVIASFASGTRIYLFGIEG